MVDLTANETKSALLVREQGATDERRLLLPFRKCVNDLEHEKCLQTQS